MNLDDFIQYAKDQNLDIHIISENGETEVKLDMGNGVIITRELLPDGSLNFDQEDFKKLYGDLEQKGDPATDKVKQRLEFQGETLIKELKLEEDSVVLQTLKELTKEKGKDPETIRLWLTRSGIFVTDQEGNSIEEQPVGEPVDDFTTDVTGGEKEEDDRGDDEGLDAYTQFIVDRREDNNAPADYVATFHAMATDVLNNEGINTLKNGVVGVFHDMGISEGKFKDRVTEYLDHLLSYLFEGDTKIYSIVENALEEVGNSTQEERESFMESFHEDMKAIRKTLAKDMVLMNVAENTYKGKELLTDEEVEVAIKVSRPCFKYAEDTIVVYYGNRVVLDIAKAILLCGLAASITTKDSPLNIMLGLGSIDHKLGGITDLMAEQVIHFLAGDFNGTREVDLAQYFHTAFPIVQEDYEEEETLAEKLYADKEQKGSHLEPAPVEPDKSKENTAEVEPEDKGEFNYELLKDAAAYIMDKILRTDLSFPKYEEKNITMEELENYIEDSIDQLRQRHGSVYDQLLKSYNTGTLKAKSVVNAQNYLSFIESLIFYHKIGPKAYFCDRNLRVHMRGIDKSVETIKESLEEQGITSLNAWVEGEHVENQMFYDNVRYCEEYADDLEATARIFLANTNSTEDTFEFILELLGKQKEFRAEKKEDISTLEDGATISEVEQLKSKLDKLVPSEEDKAPESRIPEVEEDYAVPLVEEDEEDEEDLSTATEQVIAEAYKQGAKVTYLQDKYHISSGALQSILIRQGVSRHNKTSVEKRVAHITNDPEKLANLIEDYKAGVTTENLYKHYDLYKNGLYYILDSNNIPRRQG